MTTSASTPSYHILHAGALSTEIQPVLALNNSIFNGNVDSSSPISHHGTMSEWQTRLNDPLSIIAYASLPESGLEPVGFIFAHPKQHPDRSKATLHIWLAGVLPASRGTGMFHGLMKQIDEHAREKGVETLSVATFPAKFDKMYSILKKTGWSNEQDLSGGKVLFMKELPAA